MRLPVTLQIVATVSLTFLIYLMVGLPLAVLPPFVLHQLGYGSILAGLVISAQYLATLLNRPQAGRLADSAGPKRTVLIGLASGGASGALLLAASATADRPALSLFCLLASRFLRGFGESWCGTGAILWAIGRVGPKHTASVISWNGIASYGGIAAGAPLGVLIERGYGLSAIGAVILALGALGLLAAAAQAGVAVLPGKRLPLRTVLLRVMPHGLALALGTTGFGVIATFVTLYYAANGWPGAAFCLTVFGLSFILVRLVLASAIVRFGGFRTSIVSLAVEAAGLFLLWSAGSPAGALLGAALTGIGFSLVFPALGVEAVALVPAPNRGAALGAYSVFLDVSLGLAGPVAGAIAAGAGYPATFLFAAICTLGAAGITGWLYRRARERDGEDGLLR